MSIVSSEIITNDLQGDGRRKIVERHTDHLGVESLAHYRAEPGFDVDARLLARALVLEEGHNEHERHRNVRKILNGRPPGSVTFDYTARPVFHDRLRELYAKATGTDSLYISRYFDTLTNALLRDIFGMTNPQVNQLRERFAVDIAIIADINAAVGE